MVVGARSALFLPFARPRPDRRRRGARRPPTSRRTASPTTRATWRWCAARIGQRRRWCWPRPRRRSRPWSMPSAAATAPCTCRPGIGGAALPELAAIDLRRDGAGARPLALARLAAAVEATIGARRAGAAVPQPARLCAADAVPGLRPSARVPELHGLAGRASLPPRACVCHHCGHLEPPAGRLPGIAARWTRSSPAAPASSGWPRRWRRCFPTRGCRSCPRT